MAGVVNVDNVRVDKAGRFVEASADVRMKKEAQGGYVSRGGWKLEAALREFSVEVEGRVFLDVGSSTGGFTDCLLQHGAERVIAVDVGYGQLDWKIRQDPRVRVLERTNIRYLKPEDVREEIHGAVIDVSFISLRLVIPAISRLLTVEACVIALIKPQFELQKDQVGKGGVVSDPLLHQKVIESTKRTFEEEGWRFEGLIPSPLLGPKGNQEFLMYARR